MLKPHTKLPLIVAMACLAAPLASQSIEENYGPRCGGVFDLCGYVDRETGAAIIQPQFERAFDFSEGLAAVRIDGQFGYINGSGEVVIEPTFDLAGELYAGLAEVLVGDVVGVIDTLGKFVVEPQFARAIPFTKDTVIVREGTWRSGYFAGHEKLENLSSVIVGIGGRDVGLYHVSTGWITEQNLQISIFDEPSRGLIWATDGRRRDGPYGLLRADGSWQVQPQFTYVGQLYNGLAIVAAPDATKEFLHNGRPSDPYGAVDYEGNLVLPLEYSFLRSWVGDYLRTERNGRVGIVRRDGTLLGDRYFDEIARAEGGTLPRVRDGENWHSIAPDGSLLADENEGRVIHECLGGLTIRERRGMAEFSHPGLETPITPLFDLLHFYRIDCTSPVSVRRDDNWGYVTQAGRVLIDNPSFDSTFGFSHGFAGASVNGLWGILNVEGDFVIPPQFDDLRPNDEGLFRVRKEDREFWINAQGVEIPDPTTAANAAERYLMCPGGAKMFAKDDLWGMHGPDGEAIIPPEFRAITCFVNGVAWAAEPEASAWCPLGTDGQPREKPACRNTHYPYIQTHHYPEQFSDDPYESSVLWTRAFLDYGRGKREAAPIWVPDGVMGDASSSIIRQ